MNVILELEDQSIDITEYLDDEQDIEVGQELECKAFQRSVDDVRLHCSNLFGEFSGWLGAPAAGSRSRIVVNDEDRVLFRGKIERPVNFDVDNEWVSLDCFSMTKSFWDLARQTRISKATPVGQEDLLFSTVWDVVKREVTMERFGHLMVGYQISDFYATRRIRFWGYTADESIGNNGRYKDLDPRTTIDELLKAMTLYYNADIFIDPESQLLVMQKRNEVSSDVNHQLDNILVEEEQMNIQVYDVDKVDYLGLTLNFGKPGKPYPQRTETAAMGRGLDPGRYKWAMTFVFRSGGLEIESGLGDESDPLNLPATREGGKYRLYLDAPLGPGGCVKRKIYRTKNGGIGSLYQAGTIENNSDTVFVDETSNQDLQVPAPKASVGGTIWLRYDEEAGSWDDAIVSDDAGMNTPFGEIHDVTPRLRFLDKPFGLGLEIAGIYPYNGKTRIRTKAENSFERGLQVKINHTNCIPALEGEYIIDEVFDDGVTFSIGAVVTSPGTGGTVIRGYDIDKDQPLDVASETLLDVFAFFGNEKDRLSDLQEQWRSLFLTKKRAQITVEGLAFRIGDSCSLHRPFNGLTVGRCVIKRAKNNLTKGRTQLELLTL